MEILLFFFFLLVFLGMLTGGYLVRKYKFLKKAAREAADKREQQIRNEVGRKNQQYSQRRPSPANTQNSKQQTVNAEEPTKEARCTDTATGETIIDHHREQRSSRKIFDDHEGEYVDYEEA